MSRPDEYSRFNGKHSCGKFFSVLARHIPSHLADVAPDLAGRKLTFATADGTFYPEYDLGPNKLFYRCSCGQWGVARKVLGKFNPKKKCNAKCLAAAGPNCECECAGKNHGASHDIENGQP